MIASLLENCYINWINFKKLPGDMYTHRDFILEIINFLVSFSSKSNVLPTFTPTNAIVLHELFYLGRNNQQRCRATINGSFCNEPTRFRCGTCKTSNGEFIPLCNRTLCIIHFHNPHMLIQKTPIDPMEVDVYVTAKERKNASPKKRKN